MVPHTNPKRKRGNGVTFLALEQALDFEIDCAQELRDGDHAYWRSLLVAAIGELDGDECDDELPDPSSCKIDDWNILVDVLDYSLLWDDDWETPEMVMDRDPETARLIKERLSIDDDYYVAIAPDPTDAEINQARATLRQIAAAT
ncbi:MAG TPA: hypothetical protein VF306_06940 [Pirellulales bacterium]